MRNIASMPGWRTLLLITLPLLAALLLTIGYRTGLPASAETFTPMRNHAATEQGEVNACLRASDANDILTLGPCPGDKVDDALARWTVREGPAGLMLVNQYQVAGEPQRCLINYQWQARMGSCDTERSESHWLLRDMVPGYGRLQNAYSTEQRCLDSDKGSVTLVTCTAQAQPSAQWSTDGMPRDPEYKQTNPDAFPQPRALKVTSLPSSIAERDRVKQSMLWADWQPVGFYLNAYTPLTVTVAGDLEGATLEMLIGTPGLVVPWDLNEREPLPVSVPLVTGENTVYAPRSGLLSVRFVKEVSPPSSIDLQLGPQAEPVPFFSMGKTTNEQWQHMLKESTIPLAQLVSDKAILTSTLQSMQQAAEPDAKALLDVYQQGIDAQNAIAGLDASSQQNEPSHLRPLIVETRQSVNPTASDYRAMLPFPATGILSADGAKANWGLWHELGHHRQSPLWTWNRGSLGEVTVNIYTLAALRHWFGDDFLPPTGGPSPAHWDKAMIYLAAPDEDRDFENLEKVENAIIFVMFEQLRRAFGDPFYHKLEQAVRRLDDPGTSAKRKQLFQVEASKAANADLSDYFIRWGLRPDAQTLAAIKALGLDKPVDDPSTVPVFKGSNEDRMLRLWGFWRANGKLQVDGYAAPANARIQVHRQDGTWPDIADIDQHLFFDNDQLDAQYLVDGKQQLEARVQGSSETLKFEVVDRPAVTELSALRTPENKIWIKGRAVPPSAVIEASNQDGSWPGVASVSANGDFENDHLGDNHLVDGKETFTVRMFYADRYFKERYSAKVAQMLALSGELTENDVLIVRGKAAPPGAVVEALNSAQEWVGIQSVGLDGRFINDHLNTSYLRDGKQSLEVRLKLADSRVTRSMTVVVAKP
ncbi:M60 family metallopeptidase [Pseudomonas fluorescens]|uniref:M60 family metallopeptidase n=1 Tax=Pseudomonas fluorescens TaxID=294 RepID=UPI0020C3F240|nr:M60 family metallopeptidase [Pseudomonas fluorescens]UTL89031.1 M60 family metallopeptidase [Pseudomonas fluorescens]